MEVINVSSKDAFEKILATDKPVLVDFWATWCYPCKMQAPIVHDLAEEIGDKAVVCKVDVDENEEIAAVFFVPKGSVSLRKRCGGIVHARSDGMFYCAGHSV